MNRKTVWLPVVIGLVLVALYGIWHYSPLKLLTSSKNHSRQPQVAAFGAEKLPVIIKKRIPPRSDVDVQQSDVPRPLIVLKEVLDQKATQSVEQNEMAENSAIEKDKTLVLQPDGHLTAKKGAPTDTASNSVEPRAESNSAQPQSHLPYSIMLSSCRLPQSARKIVADQKKAGLAPYVVKVKYGNGDVWLRVLAGHYPTRNEALAIKKIHHLSDAIVKKTPYANLVGSFSTEAEVKDSVKRLKDSGYSPYVIKRAENTFQVVVGAFITREGAEKQMLELQSKGIPNEIIER
ncbi:MAG: SPOR domain-containing protein [Desulfobacterales bacterium]|jgi:cell division septation protein DedD